MRELFRVSTKAAVFNADRTKVLVIYMSRINDYGLPGGHIDKGEGIEEALRRELAEECGITKLALKRTDFFRHSDGKIILAFTGQLNGQDHLVSQQNEQEGKPLWLDRATFEGLDIEPHYRKLVLENW